MGKHLLKTMQLLPAAPAERAALAFLCEMADDQTGLGQVQWTAVQQAIVTNSPSSFPPFVSDVMEQLQKDGWIEGDVGKGSAAKSPRMIYGVAARLREIESQNRMAGFASYTVRPPVPVNVANTSSVGRTLSECVDGVWTDTEPEPGGATENASSIPPALVMPLDLEAWEGMCECMNAQDVGIILRLEMYHWRHGFLPANYQQILDIAGLKAKHLAKLLAYLPEFFEQQDDGRWVSERLAESQADWLESQQGGAE